MQVQYTDDRELQGPAQELVDFDVHSLLQLVAAERNPEPEFWLADPDGYEHEGHVLRDSSATRLMAYSREARIVYATDGCNACRHVLETALDGCAPDELKKVSTYTRLPFEMLERVAMLIRESE
jgi:hypothetical protein